MQFGVVTEPSIVSGWLSQTSRSRTLGTQNHEKDTQTWNQNPEPSHLSPITSEPEPEPPNEQASDQPPHEHNNDNEPDG